MKKSKLVKLLVSALSLCLLIGAIVGITAMADEGETETLETEIYYNVSYSEKLYLHYAIPTDTAPEGTTLQLEVYKADGKTLRYTVDHYDKVNDEDCYVFITSGVAAKEINTLEYVCAIAVDGNGDVVARSEKISYSVEQYLYTKLYDEGYAVATDTYKVDNDGLQVQRKNLYYSMLKYGSSAQKLLIEDWTGVEALGSVPYIAAPHSSVDIGKNYARYKNVFLNHDDSQTPAGKAFLYWSVSFFDLVGNVIDSGDYANGAELTVGEYYFLAAPVYGDTTSITDKELDTTNKKVTGTGLTYSLAANDATAGITEDGLSVTVPTTANATYIRYTQATSNADVNAVIFECDYSFVSSNGKGGPHFTFGDSATIFTYYSNPTTVAIYDYITQKNQLQSSSAFTIPAQTVKLRMEYFEADKAEDAYWRCYVDGVLVYAGNFIAGTADSAKPLQAEAFTYWNVGFNNGTLGTMTFDNLIMYHANLELPNKDTYLNAANLTPEDDGVLDFSIGKLKNDNVVTTASKSTTYEIVEMPNGEKVLHVNKHTGGSMGDGLRVTLTEEAEEDANTFVFETDMFVNKFQQMAIYITNGNIGITNNQYYTKIVTGSNDVFAVSSISAPVGEWVHLKLEYSKIMSGDVLKGKSVFTLTLADGTIKSCEVINTDTIDIYDVDRIFFQSQGATIHDVYYNNISAKLVYNAENHSPATKEEAKIPANTFEDKGITFDESLDSNVITTPQNSTVVDDGEGNKYLEVDKNYTNMTGSFGFKQAMSTEADAKYSVISFDICFAEIKAGGNIELWLYGKDANGASVNMIPYFAVGKDGTRVEIVKNGRFAPAECQELNVPFES